jgi:hypothetical protein
MKAGSQLWQRSATARVFGERITSRWDEEPRGDSISKRGMLWRVTNPRSATGMKQGRDDRRRNKALRG